MSDSALHEVLFVVEAGAEIGMGHTSRCAELAAELDREHAQTSVFSVNEDKAALELLRGRGLQLLGGEPRRGSITAIDYSKAPRRIVFDLTRLRGKEIQTTCAGLRDRVTVALDYFLFDEPCPNAVVDLVNHNPGAVRPFQSAGYFEGPEYAIIRSSFDPFLGRRVRTSPVKTVLVAVGGSDPSRHTLTVLDAVGRVDPAITWRIVVGPGFPHAKDVFKRAREMGDRVSVLFNSRELESTMADCDIALTNGGTTFMEALALGLPVIVLPQSEEERRFAEAISARGAARVIDGAVTADAVREATCDLVADDESRARLSATARSVVDGKGRERVARIIREAGSRRA